MSVPLGREEEMWTDADSQRDLNAWLQSMRDQEQDHRDSNGTELEDASRGTESQMAVYTHAHASWPIRPDGRRCCKLT